MITKTKAGVSDQLIEVRAVASLEAKFEGHPTEESEIGPKEVNPLPTQGSIGPSMEIELAPKLEGLLLGGDECLDGACHGRGR